MAVFWQQGSVWSDYDCDISICLGQGGNPTYPAQVHATVGVVPSGS